MRNRGLGNPEHRIEIGTERPVKLFGADVEDRVVTLLAPGVVHEDTQSVQPRHGLFHQILTERLGTNVPGKCDRLAASSPNDLHHLARIGLFRRQTDDGDVRTFPRMRDRCGTTDAGIAARYQRPAAIGSARAAIAGFAVIWTR
jgi:hypothetical protein